MDLSECLTEDSEIFLISNRPKKKSIRDETRPVKIFHKDFNHAEFIGEELCAIHNIRCAHYFIVGVGEFDLRRMSFYGDITPTEYDFQIASNDFKRPNRKYHYLRQYQFDKHMNKFSMMLEKTKDEENEHKLCVEMLNLIALDIYMGQVDRYNENIMFEEDKNGILRLAPLYDFERSLKQNYIGEDTIYDSELYSFPNIEECKKFIKRYPMFRDILASYLDVDIQEITQRAYNRRGLIVPESKWEFYKSFETKRKEIINKIVQ